MTYQFDRQYINGEWVPSDGTGKIRVENPATLEYFAEIPDGTPSDAVKAVEAAAAAQPA